MLAHITSVFCLSCLSPCGIITMHYKELNKELEVWVARLELEGHTFKEMLAKSNETEADKDAALRSVFQERSKTLASKVDEIMDVQYKVITLSKASDCRSKQASSWRMRVAWDQICTAV